MAKLVLTVIGEDQSGLVDALSNVIAAHEGNWDKSHMTQLAGKFAGIVLIAVPDTRASGLIEALEPLQDQGLLDITVDRGVPDTPSGGVRQLSLELIGQDHPGIVHDVSHALAAQNVSIRELHTETVSAPMAGGTLFQAKAIVEVPAELSIAELRERLEALANELLVEIDLHIDSDQ